MKPRSKPSRMSIGRRSLAAPPARVRHTGRKSWAFVAAVAMAIVSSTCAQNGDFPMHDVQHVSISIKRQPADVYEFASNPRNLPRWAAGLVGSEVKPEGDEWVADAPFGKVRVKFAPKNPYGVMDHDVRLESGVIVHNAMRVVPSAQGSEFIFTVIRQPGISDEKFAADKAAVEKDLKTLKEVLERT